VADGQSTAVPERPAIRTTAGRLRGGPTRRPSGVPEATETSGNYEVSLYCMRQHPLPVDRHHRGLPAADTRDGLPPLNVRFRRLLIYSYQSSHYVISINSRLVPCVVSTSDTALSIYSHDVIWLPAINSCSMAITNGNVTGKPDLLALDSTSLKHSWNYYVAVFDHTSVVWRLLFRQLSRISASPETRVSCQYKTMLRWDLRIYTNVPLSHANNVTLRTSDPSD